jgi:hypothetical protein
MDAPAAQAASPNVQSAAQQDHLMALNIRSFVFVAALCLPVTAAMAQAQQPSQQRDDPASVGTGPSSKAPGEMNYEAPKRAPVTTNDRGVTMPAGAPTPGDSKNPGSEQRERSDAREE